MRGPQGLGRDRNNSRRNHRRRADLLLRPTAGRSGRADGPAGPAGRRLGKAQARRSRGQSLAGARLRPGGDSGTRPGGSARVVQRELSADKLAEVDSATCDGVGSAKSRSTETKGSQFVRRLSQATNPLGSTSDLSFRVLRDWAKEPDRKIPAKDASHLLLATWNIANLRVQDRRQKDYRLISEVLHWLT